MRGLFTISLDFELHWGGFEKWPLEHYRKYFLSTRQAIPRMLDLFEKYNVHTTWATVGLLFHRRKTELLANTPPRKPSYHAQELSAYAYTETTGIGEGEDDDPFHFAPSLIKRIAETPNQEIGTHTYAHYYCNEPGQTVDQFQDDLKAAQRVAKEFGFGLTSLVFPRNQFNDDYLRVCYEEGIRSVRSNPRSWFWSIQSTQHESAWKRLNRGVDAYFPITGKHSYQLTDLPQRQGFPLCLPASRLLRPYRPQELVLNGLKIRRVKNEMETAARLGEVYHLWWHPHNFGNYPSENLAGLKSILEHFSACSDKWGMRSLHMGETADLLRHGK